MMTQQMRFLFFSTQKLIFNQKHIVNTIGILLNKSMAFKNEKNTPKSIINPRTNLLELRHVFSGAFKVKTKTHNLSSSRHIELFDIKIDRFSSQNHLQ